VSLKLLALGIPAGTTSIRDTRPNQRRLHPEAWKWNLAVKTQ
jgi:hypothetical protein